MSLDARLKKRAQGWASLITRRANEYLGNKKGLISVKSTVESAKDGVVQIRTAAVGIVARAYEYGSGIHSRLSRTSPHQEGSKGKIIIAPKTAPVLAFNWEVLKKYPVGTKFPNSEKIIQVVAEGRGIFHYVEHPGVKAVNGGKGYLAPAINETRKNIRDGIRKDMEDEVTAIFRKSLRKKQ